MKAKRQILFSDYATPQANPAREAAAIAAARSALRAPRRDIRFAAQLRTQLGYIHPLYWLGAVALMLAGILPIVVNAARGQHMYTMEIAILLGAIGPALAAIGAPELAKSYTHNMWELESACVHSLSRLISIRMLITGGTALPLLAAVLLAASRQVTLPLALVSLVVPFLFSCAACYLALGLLRGVAGSIAAVAASALVALANWMATYLFTYNPSLPLALVGILAGAACCALAAAFTLHAGRKTQNATAA